MNRLIISLVLLLIIGSCKKSNPPYDPCRMPFSQVNSSYVTLWVGNSSAKVLYGGPTVNPHNPDDIAYIRVTDTLGLRKTELWVWNYRTKVARMIVPDAGGPDWGKNGWILYSDNDGYIYKIRPDGKDMTLLTRGWNPIWNADCSGFTAIKYPTGNILFDPEGNPIDTIGQVPVSSLGLGDSIVYMGDPHGATPYLVLYEYKTQTQRRVELSYTSESGGNPGPVISWFPDYKHVIWRNRTGVYITNMQTGSTTIFKSTCETTMVGSLVVASDGHTIYFDREKITATNPGVTDAYFYESYIYRINVDGTGEEILNL